MTDELTRIPEAIALSRKTLRIIRQNLAIALGTAGALLAGVLLGAVHMGGGMLVHEASLLLVVLNSMRLLSNRSAQGRASLPACKKERPTPDRSGDRL